MPKTTAKTADETPQPRVRRTRRAMKPSSRKRAAAPAPVSHEEIALRAYELHLLGAAARLRDDGLMARRVRRTRRWGVSSAVLVVFGIVGAPWIGCAVTRDAADPDRHQGFARRGRTPARAVMLRTRWPPTPIPTARSRTCARCAT